MRLKVLILNIKIFIIFKVIGSMSHVGDVNLEEINGTKSSIARMHLYLSKYR